MSEQQFALATVASEEQMELARVEERALAQRKWDDEFWHNYVLLRGELPKRRWELAASKTILALGQRPETRMTTLEDAELEWQLYDMSVQQRGHYVRSHPRRTAERQRAAMAKMARGG